MTDMNNFDDRVDALLKDWETKGEQPSLSTGISSEEATQLGFLKEESQPIEQIEDIQEQDNELYNESGEREFQKLGAWDTTKDIAKAVGVEASHFFMPKSKEWQYESKTKFAENMKYLYRYGVGTAAFLLGGEAVAGIKALGYLGNGAKALFAGGKLIKTGVNASKAAKIGATVANGAISGAGAGALADFTLYRPEENEGHLADVFGDTDNELINFLQTQEDDSEFEARLKNVLDGVAIGVPVGVASEFTLTPLIERYFKSLHKTVNAKTPEEAEIAAGEVLDTQVKLDAKAQTLDLLEDVKALKTQADETGEELDQLIIDSLPAEKQSDARAMGRLINEGKEVYTYEDGTFAIKIEKWEDAHKVTPENYKKQLREVDPDGNLDIEHMNDAVKHTWVNRGWIGENEELIITSNKRVDGVLTEVNKGNTKLANKIAKNYQDKWQIDNKVKVEFVDGLTIKGQAVEGNTTATKYQGKVTKTKQNAIDKKKLQISKLEDKITMAEGGNKEVADPLDNLKEELRIAQNELKELEKAAKGTNKIPDITIRIDTNAKDPYAVLRSELEHARDIAKGEVPKQSEKHFSRYEGMNEGEVASEYVYKKAQGKANATSQSFMNDGQTLENGVKYNQETINESTRNTNGTNDRGLATNRSSITEDNEGISRAYTRGSYNGTRSWLVEGTHTLPQDIKNILEQEGYSTPDFHELKAGDEGMANIFFNALAKAKEFNPKIMASVDLHETVEYKDMKLFLTDDENCGFAIKPDGDLISVFSYPKGSGRNKALIALALQQGATKLDCYDVGLPKIYKRYGFEEVARDSWDEKYKPKDWDKEHFKQWNNGEPDVVYMELRKTPIEPEQLKLNFDEPSPNNVENIITYQSTENLVSDLSVGKLELKSVENIEAVLAKTVELDPEISGKTFMDVAADSESYFNKQINEGTIEETTAFVRGLTVQKAEIIDQIVREQIACTKVIGMLKDQLDNADIGQYSNILTSMKNLQLYNKQLASAFGRALVYQKINKEALETFGEHGLSDATKMGIYTITDILDRIGKQTLNFTRIKPIEVKQALYAELEKIEPIAYQGIMEDKALLQEIDKAIDKTIRAKDPEAIKQFHKDIKKYITQYDNEKCAWYVKLCDDTKQAAEVVTKYSRKATSYMINNVLGTLSLTKNVLSGGVQGIAYPTTKILGGVLTGNFDISRQGLRTLEYGLVNFGETMRLASRAFIVGEGLMTNTKEVLDGVVEKGFHEWSFDFSNWENSKITIQNLHSFFPRVMMASDELMTQLNYRALMRAKAATIADSEIMAGKITQAEWADRVDTLFKEIAVNKEGKPLDFKAFAEAKDMLFQVPLDRKLFDPLTGQKKEVDTQSLMLKTGSVGQMTIEKIPPLRLLFPFIKTPTNIADSVIKSHPLYMAFSPDFRAKLTAKDPMIKAKAVGMVAGSCMLYTAGIIAGTQGVITGTMPFDQKEKTALLRTGWKPYSIKLGDRYYSYQGIAPYDSILAACADYASLGGKIQDKQHEMAWDDIFTRLLATTINTTVDQAGFRTNSAKLLDLLNPSLDIGRKQTVLASIAGGLLPASANVRDIQTVLNGFERPQIEAEMFYQKVLKNYLPMFIQADYQRDVFGRRVDLHNYLITSATEEDFDSPEYQEMVRLAEYGWTPSEIKNIVTGTKLPLTDFKDIDTGRSAKDAFGEALYTVKIGGKTIRQAVAELSQDDYYKHLPVGNNTGNGKDWSKVPYETQIKLMTSLFKEYADEAKNNVLDNSDRFVNSQGETMTEAKERLHYEMELQADSIIKLGDLY